MQGTIVKTYSGKMGCMCGCRGKWNYTEFGASETSWDVSDAVNERGAKIIANRVLNNPNRQVDEDAECVYVEDMANNRMQAVYFG